MDKQKKLLKKIESKSFSNTVNISASKSESNRLLLIDSLAQKRLRLDNLSTARDTQTMRSILEQRPDIWDVKDAGTTMRFLTAFLGLYGQQSIITGTERMKNRPIGPLVDALQTIGSGVEYIEKEGYPPLRITGLKDQKTERITIPGNVSSQYISALLMIAPCLPRGLQIRLTTEIFSRPYIEMTLHLMEKFGVKHEWEGQIIKIKPHPYQAQSDSYSIESDWSSASYWYSFLALNPEGGELFLPNLRELSTQGDQAIVAFMDAMGVKSDFEKKGFRIRKKAIWDSSVKFDFRKCPDLAQTVMVVAASKGISLEMTGLESLKIKETDRIRAMMNELSKIGAKLEENHNVWTLTPSAELPRSVEIETYEDHRMAMAFAPLSCLMDVKIIDPSVVKKSYPNFWDEVAKISHIESAINDLSEET